MPNEVPEWLQDWKLIEDAQERFELIMAQYGDLPGVKEEEKVEENRVEGCVSQVWLAMEKEGEACHFRVEADAPMVHALAQLVVKLYQGRTSEEVGKVEVDWIGVLQLQGLLSTTRKRGLAALEARVRELGGSGGKGGAG